MTENTGAIIDQGPSDWQIIQQDQAGLAAISLQGRWVHPEPGRVEVRLVREESAVSRSPEALSARLDAVSRTLGETSRFLDQHAEIFSDVSMTDFETSSVPSLPREPDEEAEEQAPRPPRPRIGQRQR